MTVYRFEDIAFNSTKKKKPVEEDKYTYLGLEHLDPDSIYVTRYGADIAPKGQKLIMKKGDVLFGKRRAYQKKVAIAPFDGIFSAHGMVLRPKEDVIDKDFFPLFIKSDYFLDEAIKISVGSLSPTVNWKNLKELKFELPSLSEQKKLAAVLWSIYETKEEYKKLIDATDELIKSQFIEVLNSTENKKKLTEISRPKQWKTIATQYFTDDGYPVYGANGQIGYYTEYNHEMPTITIACRGASCGAINVTREKSYINGNAMCLDNVDDSVDLRFLEYALRTIDFSYVITGSAQPQITANNLNKVIISIPEMEVQLKCSEFVEASDKSKFALQEAIKNLEALSKKIIAKSLMTAGKE